ncbi:phosphate ABC transporter substrate-binding protein [Ethanoligenens harbinense]|uniref:Phosphate-binding protein n=1 Tax=Ethanoligenens harbinense (strain DSM 18485 / JCM 12961 / CGMCC 1.5033 / YUAN-3) TaxID=663278 RepID=E6U796_ETHHY|nr:phosphate ABC transporter substrate-binding protein [Ethanoligenens harbinense]ADU25831.1 phosphate binding protein [Ethanoligenens harbinense YUAN-3]AVQ94992.1 phosphate ABC transporter substrate-binding protein [Ethanoligenens harbinense YUAN-3]AYF37684.1 phosphate ABC transporter substrate-binding protein [Ethanoligenens harbinense]AYF40404.1 phosphate ABC transporter substrate-binding protein [Ethanoligenens harbinense]QCN91239.1 phosphate ABC transporter substrate-binding protein [Etha
MKKLLAAVASVAMLGVLFTACSNGTSSSSSSSSSTVSGTVTAAGSSALKPLVDAAKTAFQQKNPDVSITVSAGGSGVGLQQVAAGTVDIGDSDVTAESKLPADQAKTLVDHQVAVIGVAVITSTDVKVSNLTTEQLTNIFTGKTKNWSEVGGPNEAITLVTRPSNSGTRALFKQYALNNVEESTSALNTDDSGVLLQDVAGNKGAIGYVALSYLVTSPNVSTVSIDNVAPTLDNIYSGKYKVWGTEHMYTKGEAKGAAAAFIKYMQSADFATRCETLGYGIASKVKVPHADTSSASSSASSSATSSK